MVQWLGVFEEYSTLTLGGLVVTQPNFTRFLLRSMLSACSVSLAELMVCSLQQSVHLLMVTHNGVLIARRR
jgi:hypothetical protein